MAVATRKIQIIPAGDFKETYQKLKDWRYHSFRLANLITAERYSIAQRTAQMCRDNEDLKWADVEESLMKERVGDLLGKTTKISSNFGYCLSKEPEFSDNLMATTRVALANTVNSAYKTDIKDILAGRKALRNYRLDKMNIYLPSAKGKKASFYIKDNTLMFKAPGKLHFKVNLGRDKSNNRDVIEKLMDGTYKMPDVFIKLIDNKIFVFVPVNFPKVERKLDPNISVGVDLGLSIPAYCALSKGLKRSAIGTGKQIIDFRRSMKKRREALQKGIQLSSGGRGRKNKMKAMESLRGKEANWVKTKNHEISKKIIDFALTNNAGCVKMELLEGFSKEHSTNMILKNWTYFQLQEMIKYKADREGITVVYVDPYHTSQTCSKCGHQHKDNRKNQKDFICTECGFESNADYNAAVNIARSEKIVTRKEDCTYYKKVNKK